MADDSQDFSTPPSEIDIASVAASTLDTTALSGDGAQALSTDGGVPQTFPFTFCFRYNGQPWGEQVIYASDLNGATVTANQLAALLNQKLVEMGYPALCTVTAGSC